MHDDTQETFEALVAFDSEPVNHNACKDLISLEHMEVPADLDQLFSFYSNTAPLCKAGKVDCVSRSVSLPPPIRFIRAVRNTEQINLP